MTTQSKPTPTSWHIGNWGTWGWIETILKAIGIVAGLAAFAQASATGSPITIGGNPELGAIIIVAGFTLFFVGGIFLRFMQKEVISFIYIVFAFLGHAGTLYALLTRPDMTTLPLVLGVFFVLGEAAKQVFLATTGYTEGGLNSRNMRIGAGGVLIGYVLLVVALLI